VDGCERFLQIGISKSQLGMNALWSEAEMPKPGHVGQSWPIINFDLANHAI